MSAPMPPTLANSLSSAEPYTGAVTESISLRVAMCNFEWKTGRFEVQEIFGDAPEGTLARFDVAGRKFAVVARPEVPELHHRLAISRLLTHREVQVVELVANGLRNKQIAFQLGLSEFTVAAYVKQICRKLDVNNRTAMVASCVQRFGVKPQVQTDLS